MKLDKYWSGIYQVIITEKGDDYVMGTFMNENKAHKLKDKISKAYNHELEINVVYTILPKHKRSK